MATGSTDEVKADDATNGGKDDKSGAEGRGREPERAQTVSSETATLDIPEQTKTDDIITRDFRFIPIPKYLRYHPDAPTKFDIFLNILFGVASTFGMSVFFLRCASWQASSLFHCSCGEFVLLPTFVEYVHFLPSRRFHRAYLRAIQFSWPSLSMLLMMMSLVYLLSYKPGASRPSIRAPQS